MEQDTAALQRDVSCRQVMCDREHFSSATRHLSDMFLFEKVLFFQLPDKKWGQQDEPKYYMMLNME